MDFDYSNITAADLRGNTLADYLINVEADLQVTDDDGTVVYGEQLFPVLELARELTAWMWPSPPKSDFNFESMSFDEAGSVRVHRRAEVRWAVGSTFTPERWTSDLTWEALVAAQQRLTTRLQADMADLQLDLSFVPEPLGRV